MKKYEYKFVKSQMQIGFDFDKKIKAVENQWNELGQEGWKYLKDGCDCTVFIREVEE